MTKVCLPDLGDNVSRATVSYWYFQEGDSVAEGSDLVEMTTDKATFNVPAPCSGTLLELVAQEGDEIEAGQILAMIDEEK